MVMILYSMIALYFVGIAILVLIIALSHSPQPEQHQAALPQGRGRALVYGMCATLFVLLSLLAIVVERGRFQTGVKQS